MALGIALDRVCRSTGVCTHSHLRSLRRYPEFGLIQPLHHGTAISRILALHPPSRGFRGSFALNIESNHIHQLHHFLQAQLHGSLSTASPEKGAKVDPLPAGTQQAMDLFKSVDDIEGSIDKK